MLIWRARQAGRTLGIGRIVSGWFKRWSTPFEQLPQNIDPGPADKSYRVFSTANDLVIDGRALGAAPEQYIEVLAANWGAFDPALVAASQRDAKICLELAAERLRAELTGEQLADTALTLLLDHSGSMRATHAALVVADFAEACADTLSELGIAIEVLGFTTRSWKGGWSRETWLTRGRPRYPGRLCDLLHVVHRDAGSATRKPHRFSIMRNPALYKENVDGEALIWARERLLARPQRAKVLIAVSDGAPVDDATMAANWNDILSDHIGAVIGEIEADGRIVIGGVGLDHEVGRYYSTSIAAKPSDALGRVGPAFIEQLVMRVHAAK